MLEKFEKSKKQLKELAAILNLFESEAVQLRIMDLFFTEIDGNSIVGNEDSKSLTGYKRRKTNSKKIVATNNGKKNGNTKKSSGRPTQSKILENLISDGFFDKPKTVNDIIKHCDTNLATKFKSTDLSPYLTTRTRNGTLNRIKNSASKQYEYTKA